MSNLNHIAAKPLVQKESSLPPGWCGVGLDGSWGKTDPLQPCISYPGHDWRNVPSWVLISTLTLLSRASFLVNGFNLLRMFIGECWLNVSDVVGLRSIWATSGCGTPGNPLKLQPLFFLLWKKKGDRCRLTQFSRKWSGLGRKRSELQSCFATNLLWIWDKELFSGHQFLHL